MALDFGVDLSASNQTPERQFSVDQLKLTGRVSQSASNISGSAHYGIVGIDFAGGRYAGLSTFSATIGDPNSAATEVPLGLTWDYVTDTLASGVSSALGWAGTDFEALEVVGLAVSDLVESELIEAVADAIADGVEAYEQATDEVARLQDLATIFADHVPSQIDDTLQVVAEATADSVLRVGIENANLEAFPDAFDRLLGALESALQLEVFGLEFPLIGGALDGPANFVRDLRADLMGSLNGLTSFTMEGVRRALTRIVRNQLGGSVSLNARNLDDIRYTINLSAIPITWNGQVNTNLARSSQWHRMGADG